MKTSGDKNLIREKGKRANGNSEKLKFQKKKKNFTGWI